MPLDSQAKGAIMLYLVIVPSIVLGVCAITLALLVF